MLSNEMSTKPYDRRGIVLILYQDWVGLMPLLQSSMR
jgi:hypothetical protein